MTDFNRIEKAIVFLKDNFQHQPRLEEVAEQVHLSPFHFQRIFKKWAGVSPKKFLQFISVEYAKKLLKEEHSLADVSFQTGLSGTSRLHDLFVSIEGMTPGEYKNEGATLEIKYSLAETQFGDIVIASTQKGICHLAFQQSERSGMEDLQSRFPKANLIRKTDLLQQNALQVFAGNWNDLPQIKLHLKATPFQLKVWQALLQIPFGKLSSYGGIARKISSPKASQAIGTAIGNNPVAYLIPCHRVIKATGISGQYHWGAGRKQAMLGWEAARVSWLAKRT
ncbi:MAG: bifunctional helix-turn-helix domain-containing protein/methylated-DNA--[protein]-cysteine S-methyltransferase [Cyclobacteriaceae bacterium]